MNNRRGQASTTARVIMIFILVILSIAAYHWGLSLIETQDTSIRIGYMEAKLLEIKSDILAVSREGVNSSRTIEIDLSKGKMEVLEGACYDSTLLPDKNGVVFKLTTDRQLIESKGWKNIDSIENDSSSNVSYYGSHSPGLLVGKSVKQGNDFENQYMLWFRYMHDSDRDIHYYINITKGSWSEAEGGTYVMRVRNEGLTQTAGLSSTKIRVEFVE